MRTPTPTHPRPTHPRPTHPRPTRLRAIVAPPAPVDFPDDDSTPDPPKSDGFAPAPGGHGDDHDDGSTDEPEESEPEESEPEESDPPADNSGVEFTPGGEGGDPVDPEIFEAIGFSAPDRLFGKNGTNSTPTDDDSSGRGKGDVIYTGEPPVTIRTKDDLIGNPEGARVESPKISAGLRPDLGPNQNQIMPTPDADDPHQPGNSGPPIVNESDSVGGDGSGVQQPGSGGGAASAGGQGQSGSSNGTSQSANRPTTKAGSSAAVQRFLMLLGNRRPAASRMIPEADRQ